ncbi:flagellar hook-length control protein FliK [Porcipelethomonas sp.]|uniref:flagellar hook-length control protein FliK n=1 Tax=Porcipelethomonas sp. TaxID=2981675 RepID=UPI003EF45678
METEQISQSLRASVLQQSQQGMTVSQMMSSGISFADIISIMISNTKTGGADEMNSGMLDSQLFQTDGQSFSDSIIPEQFSDIFSLISPELMKNAGNQNSLYSEVLNNSDIKNNLNTGLLDNSDNQNSFYDDLLLNNIFENSSETIDFSDSIIKADPSQLAGLMDFIRTGTDIPLFTQLNNGNSDSTKSGIIQDIKSLFDPNEMLKSGEMEIVSYIPASQSDMLNDSEMSGSLEDEVLDFYRTMNSVKENAGSGELKNSQKNNSDNDISDDNVYNVENLGKFAEPIDISFDRAEAEMTMNKAEYEPVDKQVLRGVSENLEQGKSEFTVKLKPEGLGEILVKLVSDSDGKMLLTMVASSEKTAELLNRDLASLQSTLSQHNVEIANNSIEAARNVMPASSAFDQYDQRRQDEGNQQNQYRQLKSQMKNNISVGNVSFDSEPNLQMNSVPDQALNIMI